MAHPAGGQRAVTTPVGLTCLELPHFSTAFFSKRLFTNYLKTFLKKRQRLEYFFISSRNFHQLFYTGILTKALKFNASLSF